MDYSALIPFFMWCTIINGGILILWACIFCFTPEWVYKTQSICFKLPREKFDLVFYLLIGIFKMLFIIFNVVPLIALWILR